jgi:hypothetical protein
VTTDRIFLVFALIVGLAVGGTLVLVPPSRTFVLPPYFWLLIAFALFEGGLVYARRGGGSGPPITMQTRLIGFGIALALMLLIPMWAGVQIKLF